MFSFEKLGHRSAIRTLDISDNNQFVVTGSGESIKVWDSENLECVKSFETSNYVVSLLFLPKHRYFVAGDKEGNLSLFDMSTSEEI
jgi:U3 small nucleolar RNA-associated protein 12